MARAKDKTREDPPTPVAAIDIGSSAVRMAIAEVDAEGGVRSVDSLHKAVGLGRDAFTQGRLSEETIRSVCAILRDFHDVMDSFGVREYRAVATSAVREAENRDTLLDRVFIATGLDAEVIEGSEENRLTFVAVREALQGRRELKERMLLVEVGGGNADITLSDAGTILHADTYQMGAIRMYAQAASIVGDHEQRTTVLRGSLHNMVEKIRRVVPIRRAQHFVAIGGDVRFAARYLCGRPAEDEVAVVPRKDFIALCKEMEGREVDDVVARYGISYAQAETIMPALLAYRLLLQATGAPVVTVPQVTLRQGLLLDLAYRLTGKGSQGWQEQIITSAISIGEKFHFDRKHAEQVTRLALDLFDQLQPQHRLSKRDRLMLEVAAVLHDIGAFINPRSHHLHSYYLVGASDIFGLRKAETELIATLARYHRRDCPQSSHPGYASLDRESRVKVCKLAALLRLADALDRPHVDKVARLRTDLTEDELVIFVDSGKDWTIERKAISDKGDLFENTFGRHVLLRPQS